MPEMALFNTVASFEKVFYKDNNIFRTDTPTITVENFKTLEDFMYEENKNYFSKYGYMYAAIFFTICSSRTEKCIASMKTIEYTADNGLCCHSSI